MSFEHGVGYTRYTDDLFFSSKQKNVLEKIEREAARIVNVNKIPASLKINTSKTRHS